MTGGGKRRGWCDGRKKECHDWYLQRGEEETGVTNMKEIRPVCGYWRGGEKRECCQCEGDKKGIRQLV